MILVLGGYAQGKLQYIKNNYDIEESKIYDAQMPENSNACPIVINNLNEWARDMYNKNIDATERLEVVLTLNPNCIIISDEIGNGIVPIDPVQRGFREWMGRLQIELASRADEVVRITCGIGQKIK